MEIKHDATAGTLESSDVMVTVEPGSGGVEVQVESPVLHQFGAQIRRIVLESLERQSNRKQILESHRYCFLFKSSAGNRIYSVRYII